VYNQPLRPTKLLALERTGNEYWSVKMICFGWDPGSGHASRHLRLQQNEI